MMELKHCCNSLPILPQSSLKVVGVHFAQEMLQNHARDSNLHVHFKNTYLTVHGTKGLHIQKATKYLEDVTLQKVCAILILQWWH